VTISYDSSNSTRQIADTPPPVISNPALESPQNAPLLNTAADASTKSDKKKRSKTKVGKSKEKKKSDTEADAEKISADTNAIMKERSDRVRAPVYNRPMRPQHELTSEMKKHIYFAQTRNANKHMYDSHLKHLAAGVK
jgi:hypothetical protein